MKIYFYNTKDCQSQAQQAQKFLHNLGASVLREVDKAGAGSSDNSLAVIEAMVIMGRQLDAQAGYMMALGLSHGKNVLYLLPAGSAIDEAVKNLLADKKAAGRFVVAHFSDSDLGQKIADFLEKIDNSNLAEYFNIKYTLRVSRKISDYLNWRARASATKKADWIRDFIKELMDKDADYQKHLKNKFRLKNK